MSKLVNLHDSSRGLLPTSFLKVPTSFLLGAEKLITDELFYYVTNWHAFDERFIT